MQYKMYFSSTLPLFLLAITHLQFYLCNTIYVFTNVTLFPLTSWENWYNLSRIYARKIIITCALWINFPIIRSMKGDSRIHTPNNRTTHTSPVSYISFWQISFWWCSRWIGLLSARNRLLEKLSYFQQLNKRFCKIITNGRWVILNKYVI